MSESLEHLLDTILNMREQHRRRHKTDLALMEKATRDRHRELDLRQTKFANEVGSIIHGVVEQANHHLATRPERCQFHKVSGYFAGPLYPGGSACIPIAYELRVDGQEVGETLIIELTHDGMIEALLGPFRPSDHQDQTARVSFGCHPIPLYSFDAGKAKELLVQYLAAITRHWQLR